MQNGTAKPVRKHHPLADLFPMLEGADLDALAADIKAHGLRDPIVLHPDGSILDGRNRAAACARAGIEPKTATYWGEESDAALIAFIASKNLHRRHLTVSQRAMIAAQLATMRRGTRTDLAPRGAMSDADAAKAMKVGERSVERAKDVERSGSAELVAKVMSGEMSVTAAQRAAHDHAAALRPVEPAPHVPETAEATAPVRRDERPQTEPREFARALHILAGRFDIPAVADSLARDRDVLRDLAPAFVNLRDFGDAVEERTAFKDAAKPAAKRRTIKRGAKR